MSKQYGKYAPGDPIMQIIPTVGPKVCKYYQHWAVWIPRVPTDSLKALSPPTCGSSKQDLNANAVDSHPWLSTYIRMYYLLLEAEKSINSTYSGLFGAPGSTIAFEKGCIGAALWLLEFLLDILGFFLIMWT